jgi:hypothetical protein
MPSLSVRLFSATCLAGVAITHVLDLPDKLSEAHYMAALFCALIAASLVLGAAVLLDRRAHEAIGAAGVLSALTIAGYVWSRTIGFPQLEDHIGMWADPIGIASLVCETALVALAGYRAFGAAAARRPATARPAAHRAPAPQP